MATRKLPAGYYERWFYFMNPHVCSRPVTTSDPFYRQHGGDGGVSGNVTKSVVGFWIRRSIDGTMETFAEGLQKLVAAYEPELLEERPTE